MADHATSATYLPHFVVARERTLRVTRYEVRESRDAGGPTGLLALAEQSRTLFGTQAHFCSDALESRPVFAFKSRNKLSLNASYDITDESGSPIGAVREDFGASLLRTTFHVEGSGFTGTGRERHRSVALVNRFTSLDFVPVHVDFVDAEGRALFSVERKMSLACRYRVTVPDQRVDYRFAAGVAVIIDDLAASSGASS